MRVVDVSPHDYTTWHNFASLTKADGMRFALLDRIEVLVPGEKIEAVKCLSLAEEYLADHFPQAPVLPGVMMLEALVQASAWLIRVDQQFAHSLVTLSQVRAVKYANFVEPGQTLRVSSQITGAMGQETKLKAEGQVEGKTAVSCRLVMTSANLSDTAVDENAKQDAIARDAFIIERMKRTFRLLCPAGFAALAS